MKIYDTTQMDLKSETEKLWVYNGLDCCITSEVFDVISSQLDNVTTSTYEFSKSLQAPILEMNMHGVLVDEEKRHQLIQEYQTEVVALEVNLNKIVYNGIGWEGAFNWRSNQQLIRLFYSILKVPEVRKRNTKGEMTPTVNREALEKISAHFYAQPIVSHLLKMRDQAKRIGTLKTEIDPDHRIRTSYNIAGTTTGRLSSSFSDFGTGTNLQNIEQRLRRIFIADSGYKFANIDLKSGDSFGVGLILYSLFADPTYLDACETGDIHTSVGRMTWKELPWTGEIGADKKIAESTPGYRDLSVRDLCKKLGHGTNYYGKPPTMAKHTKLPIEPIKDFQTRYFSTFPLQKWHGHVEYQLRAHGFLVTLLGRKRWFFGRRDDDTTLREAIAYEPQSITSDVINRGLLNVWRANICQVLLQVHDSILVQYPEEHEDTILPRILKLMEIPLQARDRTVIIPAEAKIGWNWANVEYNKAGQVIGNPDGLITYKGKPDERKRGPQASILDRPLRGVY